ANPLLELFRAELAEQLAALSRGLLILQQDPSSAQPLEELTAAAHTLRGAARLINLDGAVRLAAGLENVFAALQGGRCPLDAADLATCLQAHEMLAGLGDNEPADWARTGAADLTGSSAALDRL